MFGHYTFLYVTFVRTENNSIFVCSICSVITHFVFNRSSDTRHYIFVCNMGSDIIHFHISSDTRHHIFVCSIGSDILYFRMLHIKVQTENISYSCNICSDNPEFHM